MIPTRLARTVRTVEPFDTWCQAATVRAALHHIDESRDCCIPKRNGNFDFSQPARMVPRPSGRVAFCIMDLRPHIDKFARRFTEVEAALSDPKAFDAAMTSAVRAGRVLAWLIATGSVLVFAAFTRAIVRDWRVAFNRRFGHRRRSRPAPSCRRRMWCSR